MRYYMIYCILRSTVSRFLHYFSCYIADYGLPLGQGTPSQCASPQKEKNDYIDILLTIADWLGNTVQVYRVLCRLVRV